jgi:hypothetical protein
MEKVTRQRKIDIQSISEGMRAISQHAEKSAVPVGDLDRQARLSHLRIAYEEATRLRVALGAGVQYPEGVDGAAVLDDECRSTVDGICEAARECVEISPDGLDLGSMATLASAIHEDAERLLRLLPGAARTESLGVRP